MLEIRTTFGQLVLTITLRKLNRTIRIKLYLVAQFYINLKADPPQLLITLPKSLTHNGFK